MTYNGKTNWQVNEIVMPADMNRIEQGIIDANKTILQDNTYNLVNASKNVLGTVESTVNPLPFTWTQETLNLSYYQHGFVIRASSHNPNLGGVAQAFDNSRITSWGGSSTSQDWILFEFPTPTVVAAIYLHFSITGGNNPAYKVQGSNNGVNWTDLFSTSSAGISGATINLSTTGSYKIYRLIFDTMGGTVQVNTLAVAKIVATTYIKAYTLPDAPTSWQENQRFLIQTPATPDSVGVVSNTFNNVPVRTILQPDKKYELVYRELQFDVVEVN